MRELIIAKLLKRQQNAAKVLRQVYRHDLVIVWQELQKEIEIQQAYQQHEGEK